MRAGEIVREADRRSRGLPRILAVDLTVFVLLLIAYGAVRRATPVWPRPFHFPSGLMTVSMGMFAAAASFVLHVALRSEAKSDFVMVRRMIALALAGWAAFLFLLLMEWGRLYFFEGVTLFSNPWHVRGLGISYYGFTASIAAHMLTASIGLIRASSRREVSGLFGLTLLADFTNALFLPIAFLVIGSATDLSGF